MRKRGRPAKEDSKKVRFMFRMDIDDWDKLTAISNETGVSKSEILRKALNTQYKIHSHLNECGYKKSLFLNFCTDNK